MLSRIPRPATQHVITTVARIGIIAVVLAAAMLGVVLLGGDIYRLALGRFQGVESPPVYLARLDLSSCLDLDVAERRQCLSEAAAGRALELAGAWIGQARDAVPGCESIRGASVAACTSTGARDQAASLIGDAIVEAAIEVAAGCRDLDEAPWECVAVAAQRVRQYADTTDVGVAAEALVISCGGQRGATFDTCVSGNEPVVRQIVKTNLRNRAAAS